jgi:hypothetical protein
MCRSLMESFFEAPATSKPPASYRASPAGPDHEEQLLSSPGHTRRPRRLDPGELSDFVLAQLSELRRRPVIGALVVSATAFEPVLQRRLSLKKISL